MDWIDLQQRARIGRRVLAFVVVAAALSLCAAVAQDSPPEQPQAPPEQPEITYATGVVYHDKNGNGVRDDGEPGIPGVRVSNQHQVVATDGQGRWRLAHDDDTTFFVVKPSGWRTPVTAHNLPRFFYHHRPKGSPPLRFGGIAPTGELPASIDFPLVPHEEPEDFQVVFFADPQPYTLQQVDYVANDVVQELIGTDAAFGVTLGDIVGDDLNLFEHINAATSRVGIPWFNVIGNHDLNFDAANDVESDETFRRIYGPNYYSWDYGKVHFVALDNVFWDGDRYTGYLTPTQLNWLEQDLAHVPDDRLVVLLMHIPLTSRIPLPTLSIRNRRDLYRNIQHRRVLAMSGHTHTFHHMFIEEDGWEGEAALEHANIVTVSGNWWRGDPDERGIPHATMRCGGPNGYMVATFKGNQHSLRYKAAGRPDAYQMQIHAPDEVWSDRTDGVTLYANVFGGSERSLVHMRVGDGSWQPMQWTLENDPGYVEIAARQRVPSPMPSNHLWKVEFPAGVEPGTHEILVRTTDVYGQHFEGRRLIRVMDAALRPVIASIEPPVLLPDGEITVTCSRLAGDDVQIIVPAGSGYSAVTLRVTREGNVLKAQLPRNLAGGNLRVRADLMLSDEWVFELGSESRNGLRGEYFTLQDPSRSLPDLTDRLPVMIRRDANVDYSDGAAFRLPFEPVNFAVRWTGQFHAAAAGEYGFALETDDASRMWLNGELVVDNDNAQGKRQRVGTIELAEGRHEIRIEYQQRGGSASAVLKWKPPGVEDGAAVPADVLFPPGAK